MVNGIVIERKNMEKEKVGIIGCGKCGSFFALLLARHGCEVKVGDPKKPPFVAPANWCSNEEVVKWADVVLFATPLKTTPQIIASLGHLSREEQLWLDCASVKRALVAALLETMAEVASIHHLCAPPRTAPTLSGFRVVVCRPRMKQWTTWFNGLLVALQGEIIEESSAEHDEAVAPSQAFLHAAALVTVLTLLEACKTGVGCEKILKHETPPFEVFRVLAGRILGNDPNLLASIQTENANNLIPLLMDMRDHLGTLIGLVADGRDDEVSALFRTAAKCKVLAPERFGEMHAVLRKS